MAGIYIHVPYCKTRCIYCDFYTQTNSSTQSDYVKSVCKELELRRDYLSEERIETIYFGGGTPSQLTKADFDSIFDSIYRLYSVDTNAEITIEANPDDLSQDYLSQMASLPINRLSIGIQSFNDDELKFLNRRHSAQKAKDAVRRSQDLGINNISIDLMYGLPNQTIEIWQQNLVEALNLAVPHISSYHLIYEEGTKLFRLLKKGEVRAVSEELSVEFFSEMIKQLKKAGFEHYEISNFAKNGLYSRHNSSYWLGKKYLGLGPAAHSFDGVNRAWNISSIHKYVDGIQKGNPAIEIEDLDIYSTYNDFILTCMRTMWGVSLNRLQERFGDKFLDYCLKNVKKHIQSGAVINDKDTLKLTTQGIFISDGVMSDLMWVE